MGLRQPVQYFKRKVYQPAAITVDPTIDNGGYITFQLNEIPTSSEFTSLYDQYKIAAVKLEIIPRYNVGQSAAAVGAGTYPWIGQVFTALDYDGGAALTTVNQLMEYQNVHMTRTTNIHKRYLKPRLLNNLDNQGIGAAHNPIKSFVDSAFPGVVHYGVRYSIPQFAPLSDVIKFDIVKTFYLKFKNVR